MALIWKKGYFWPAFHIHVFRSPFWIFLPYQFWKKIRIYPYQVWFLFGVIPGVDSFTRHFGTIVESTIQLLWDVRSLANFVEWVHCLFLFPPCFRKNVVITCKIGSFLCSLDNLLQKNVISPGKSYKNSFSTYLTHIHTVFCSPFWIFLPYQFWKKKYEFILIKYGFSLVWFLVLVLIRTILEQLLSRQIQLLWDVMSLGNFVEWVHCLFLFPLVLGKM